MSDFPNVHKNRSEWINLSHDIRWDDATWILTSAFIIFTMQSGFGLLESGSASVKNEVNIMVKNAVDVLFGGISYWMFGFGFSAWVEGESNQFMGVSHFFFDTDGHGVDGHLFALFFFKTSFATTATTIVSGAMAERTKLEAYILFSFFNTFIYCFPSHWMWRTDHSWFRQLGATDIAGASTVHLVGGVTGLVATVMLGPRTGRFKDKGTASKMGSPTNAVLGLFMLWWGWLGFNCGSTYGIANDKWVLATRSAVATITSSIGGGIVGIALSYVTKKRKFDIVYIINGVLGSLVSITAYCALARPWEGLVIGAVGGGVACLSVPIIEMLRIDDPVSVVPVHCVAAIWGMLSVGLFGEVDELDHILRYPGTNNPAAIKLHIPQKR
ncbi:putative ammonium transporter 3 isoform X2 [Apostichopus japonicus]|uniref:putative ammonium transporter 3 isoform X2 n=1 Tax=Stichopus japonicus TaxID=307972 RepID=UPI003AB7B59C